MLELDSVWNRMANDVSTIWNILIFSKGLFRRVIDLIDELTNGDFQTITQAFGTSGIYTSIQLIRILDIFNRLQELLEDSKK